LLLAETLRDYELVLVLSPEMAEEDVTASVERLRQTISQGGGEVVDVNIWGRRRLAYPIKRHMEGNYIVTQVRLDPSAVSGLESGFRISDEVIRHLIIRSEQ
jgi:small subunit ribosomal protein S6